jgi:hypothetical protein
MKVLGAIDLEKNGGQFRRFHGQIDGRLSPQVIAA